MSTHALFRIVRLLRHAMVPIVVMLLTEGVTRAQSGTATLTGTILDETGAGLPDVAVVLLDLANDQRHQAVTTGEGTFAIPLMPPGRYSLSARRDGFTPLAVPEVVLKANDQVALRLEMKVEPIDETVVVTARKRGEERVLDVPIPVSTLDATRLTETNQVLMRDYAASVPNFSVTPYHVAQQSLSIRGVTTGGLTIPTVGITVDDVPFGSITAAHGNEVPDLDPGDLVRVEILRGPQGALYGAGSMSGLLKYVTKDPSFDRYSGRVEVGMNGVSNGPSPGYNLRASANVPLGDTVALRVSGYNRRDAGYIDNATLNIQGINEAEASGARVSALWRASDVTSLKVSGLYQHRQGKGLSEVDVQSGLPDLQQVFPTVRGVGGYERSVHAYSAVFKTRIRDLEVTSLTGYNTNRGPNSSDRSFVNGVHVQAEFGVAGAPFFYGSDITKFSQEAQLSGRLGRRLTWRSGAFYSHETGAHHNQLKAAVPATGEIVGEYWDYTDKQAFDEVAGFGDVIYALTDRFDVQLGGRQSHTKLDLIESRQSRVLGGPNTGPLFTPRQVSSTDAFTYLVTPRFRFSPDVMTYVRLASGFRIGAPNVATLLPPGAPLESKSDETKNYEIGLKGSFLANRLSLDLSLYYIDWTDIQLRLRDAASNVTYNDNGGGAKSQGIELSAAIKPLTGLTIDAWTTYADAVLTEDFPVTSTAYGRAGDRLANTPRWSGRVALEQTFPLRNRLVVFATAAASYVGERVSVFVATPVRERFPAYAKGDLQAGVRSNEWAASLFVSNVTDTRGVLDGGIGYFYPPSRIYITPRTVGVTISRSF